MKTSQSLLQFVCLALVFAASGLTPALASERDAYRIARGGRLYDNWFAENGTMAPAIPNPAYPATGEYRGKKAADWRCKECHGWDYLGKDGAYGKGSHFTGFPGTRNTGEMSEERMKRVLRNPPHGYDAAMLSDTDLADLALFLNHGQTDMSASIDQATKKARGGDSMPGKNHYETLCASCHGRDGKALGEDAELGKLAKKNPWEVLHKIRNGQPKSTMPALGSLDIQIAADILAYLQDQL